MTTDATTSRHEHMEWCKARALKELGEGTKDQITSAWSSMVSDLNKHSETENHLGIKMGSMLFLSGNLATREQMQNFIVGFN